MLISTATTPAKTDHPNEDFIGASSNTVVLLDGAGNPPGADQGCRHGVAWFSRTIGTTLLNRATDHPDRSLTSALELAIAEVADLHRDTCDLRHPGSPSATVVVLRQTACDFEYLVLADSTLVLQHHAEIQVITDDREAQVGAKYRGAMDALPSGSPEQAAELRNYIETMRAWRNTSGGFWVASSDPAAATEALTGSTPITDTKAAVLLSDGASRLADRFHLATWTELMQIVITSGPEELLRQVRDAEASDPHGKRWPRGKAHDDATAGLVLSPL